MILSASITEGMTLNDWIQWGCVLVIMIIACVWVIRYVLRLRAWTRSMKRRGPRCSSGSAIPPCCGGKASADSLCRDGKASADSLCRGGKASADSSCRGGKAATDGARCHHGDGKCSSPCAGCGADCPFCNQDK